MAVTQHPAPERYTPDDFADFAHTGPGTLAGRYLRRFWQPVCAPRDLPPGHAKPIRIMSEDFTLYRGEDGTPHVVAPRCAHRGTQLSTGWVEGDCVRCFYHGWKYDAAGQCVEMPAEDASFPAQGADRELPDRGVPGADLRLPGRGRAAAAAALPGVRGRGRARTSEHATCPCNYFNGVENSVDIVHVVVRPPR